MSWTFSAELEHDRDSDGTSLLSNQSAALAPPSCQTLYHRRQKLSSKFGMAETNTAYTRPYEEIATRK